MFSCTLAFDDFDAPVDLVDGGVLVGSSAVLPFAHRLLRTIVLTSRERVAVIVHERFADDPEAADHAIGLADADLQARLDGFDDHMFDWAAVTIDRRRRSVRYRASPVVSIPVYLTADERGVTIDWDYARLLGDRRTDIVWDVALAQIAGEPTYGPQTVVAGVHRATAGATLIATAAGIAVELPPAVTFDGPRELAPGADPEARLLDTVSALIAARPLARSRTAVELSGGMDSALTAMAAAAALGPGLMSIGAQFGGTMGAAQRDRRRRLCERGGFDDLEVPAERFAPFSPASRRRVRYGVWPEDESYPEMFEAMFAMLRSAGIDALVSGFGGDELYVAYPGEDGVAGGGALPPCPLLTVSGSAIAACAHRPYPRGWLQQSCWQSAASQSQRVLRYGLWPIYPYHNVALARFVSRLPRSCRRDRQLLRNTLAKVLGAPVFAGDYVKETFDPVARRGIGEHRDYLVDLVERSPLVRHPHLDRRAILGALGADPATLDRDTFNALFRLLKILCFFQ